VVSTNPFEKYATVKLILFSPTPGVKKKNICKPPPSQSYLSTIINQQESRKIMPYFLGFFGGIGRGTVTFLFLK